MPRSHVKNEFLIKMGGKGILGSTKEQQGIFFKQ